MRKRSIIENAHVSSLIAAYTRHFCACSDRRTNICQLIPDKFWTAAYANFLMEFPDEDFAEESLKTRVRDTFKELNSGTSNEKNSENRCCGRTAS